MNRPSFIILYNEPKNAQLINKLLYISLLYCSYTFYFILLTMHLVTNSC